MPSAIAAFERLRMPLPETCHGIAWFGIELARCQALLGSLDLRVVTPDLAPCIDRRRLEYVAGRLCCELALRSRALPAGPIGRNADGAPVWPARSCGSLSHGGDYVIAAAASRADIELLGLDVERIVDDDDTRAIADVCLVNQELAALRDSIAPGLLATLLFSAKEAYYKAIHPRVGRYVDFLEVAVQVDFSAARFLVVPETSRVLSTPALPRLAGRFRKLDDHVLTWIAEPACGSGFI